MRATHVLVSSVFLFLLAICIVALLPPRGSPSPWSSFFQSWQLHPVSSRSSTEHNSAGGGGGGCDYSDGRWVRDDATVAAYGEDCPFLDPGFRCMRNGRNDLSFRFNAKEMLERSRNGRIVFAGDSIGRNQWESMVCMLADAVPAGASRVYEQSGKPISRHKGYLSMVFADYNLSVEYYRAPMIVMVDRFPANATGDSGGGVRGAVRLDVLARHADRWAGADVLVLNTGHWWNLHKTVKAGNYFMVGDRLNKTMDLKEAFRLSLQTVEDWELSSARSSESYFFFRSYSPSHYRNGTWDTGGSCAEQRGPLTTNDHSGEDHSWINAMIVKTTEDIKRHGRKARFLNITHMTVLRPDGHPSRHREPGTPPDAPEDCSHWCLPGVPDMWNEVLYAHLVHVGYDTRRKHR
ncbi:protein trichome birefringence-like 8 isoform X2 [Phragmites australis]|uniref:protein trichome birefringence-like 8 isoform X2 n=1 Tax=Phragmites australis TaxID=29695 RepID=UPI002D78DBEE|nr:protein trichome birefringence-like 8 isoform X2 [Phragmites australis]